jgi:DNA-binding NarL/FixJ family response regulator
MRKVRLILADDHPVVRHGFKEIIEKDEKFQIIAECGNGMEALSLLRELEPDIAVLDISMPDLNGLQIAKKIKSENAKTEFIILTMYEEEEYFDEAMNVGVKGYILKESALTDLLGAVQSVSDGKHFISPAISDYLIRRNKNIKNVKSSLPSMDELTTVERKVLKLISENKTSKEIGELLFISYKTVQNHRNNICNKFGLKGYNKLLQFALENKKFL